MVGLPYDCLTNPLGAVRLTFERAVVSGTDPASLTGKDWGATDLFREFLFENGGMSQVPTLNATTVRWLQQNTLVKFRGMIQDMLGNELYIGAYKDQDVWRTNKFADDSQFPIDHASPTCMWERRLLYCVPVPGQNLWIESVEPVIALPGISTSPQRGKRPREDGVTADEMEIQAPVDEFQNSLTPKRPREDETIPQSSNLQDVSIAGPCHRTSKVSEYDGNSLPCLVKIYDSPESDLKLNDVFEFVGVLTFERELTMDKNDDGGLDTSFYEDATVHLPSHKVPRLHCLIHRKLTFHDFILGPLVSEPKSHFIKEIRASLMGHLTAVLGNDELAAQFLLLHLLSRVHARADTVAVGKLSLNLSGFNRDVISVFVNRIRSAISEIVPFTCCLPLAVDYLNSVPLAPKKDYQTNRLVSGVLQLAEGTHMIVDVTVMQPGTLNSTGIENVRLLKGLIDWQKVEYDFTYYKMDMETNVQMLILSEGKSNILPADVVLPFCPNSVDSPNIADNEAVKAWRWYLATVRSMPHVIEPEMQKVSKWEILPLQSLMLLMRFDFVEIIEDDLVAARQADRSLGSQELSRLLTMGRLISSSYGETSLLLDHWQMAKDLDRLKSQRI